MQEIFVPLAHALRVAAVDGQTVGECSCGAWRREAGLDVVLLTGRSREDALRAAHEAHAREMDAPA